MPLTRNKPPYRRLMGDLLCRRHAYETAKGLPHAEFKDKPTKTAYVKLQRQLFWVDLPMNNAYHWCFDCHQCLPKRFTKPNIYNRYLVCQECHTKRINTPSRLMREVMYAGMQNAKYHQATENVLALWRDIDMIEKILWEPWFAKHPDLPKHTLQRIDPESAPTPYNYRLVRKKRG